MADQRMVTSLVHETSSPIHIKLDGTNYRVWSKLLEMHITGRKKRTHIFCELTLPKEDDSTYGEWVADDAIVKSWLINSMTDALVAHFVQFDTAKDVWDAVKRSYLDVSDSSQVYELMKKSFQLRQEGRPLVTYYTEMNSIFLELDHRRPNSMKCAADVDALKKRCAEDRIYMFLAGLDHGLDQVRSRILATTPLPSLEEVFSTVRREEQRQLTMGGESHSEASALAVKGFNPRSRAPIQSTEICSFCHLKGHTADKCFKKNGYPDWYLAKRAEKRGGRSSQTTHSSHAPTATVSHVARSSSGEGTSGVQSASTVSDFWVIDSGATDHFTCNPSTFDSLTNSPVQSVQVANGTPVKITGAGNVSFSPTFSISSVLLAPTFSTNLLSISKITKHLDCSVIFSPTHCVFQDNRTKMTIGTGRERGGLYFLEGTKCLQTEDSHGLQVVSKSSPRDRILLWHCRLGHPSFPYLEHLFPKLFKNISSSSMRCEQCIFAKNHRVPFKVSFNKSSVPFTCVHTDVWGPFSTPSITGHKYFISFIDDCTRVCWIYLLKSKGEVGHVIPKFSKMIETQFHTQVKVIHSDNGREFVNQTLGNFFSTHGILHQTTCAYTPQQNGVAERKNRHILEVARVLCFTMRVPKRFWAEAVTTSVFLINRMPARIIDFQTPLKMLSQFHSIPSVLNLCPKVFGCVCYVHVHSHLRDKFDPRALKCVFLGYSSSQKGYKCFHPPTGKYYVSMDVEFCESESFFSDDVSLVPLQGEISSKEEERVWLDEKKVWISRKEGESQVESKNESRVEDDRSPRLFRKCYTRRNLDNACTPVLSSSDHNNPPVDTTVPSDSSEIENEVPTLLTPSTPISISDSNPAALDTVDTRDRRYPLRVHNKPDRFGFSKSSSNAIFPINDYISYHRLSKTNLTFALQLSSVSIPNHFQEALDQPKWKSAMVEEMNALQKNSTWEMVLLPPGKRTVGCKWVYSLKFRADGAVDRYKARLVAKGYTQTYGIDYQETFAPVAKMNTVRVILSLAVNLDWPLRQFDVKNAFLHGDLTEEVYMDPPPGFTPPEGNVCKLKKALYGLKQSPRAWFGRLSCSMKRYGFKQALADYTLFYKRDGHDITILIVYVDDMIVTGSNPSEIEKLRSHLTKEFEMKDLGTLKYFLGIEVSRSQQELILSQRKYVLDLLAETSMSACVPVDTPIEVNHGLSIYPDQIPTNKERYQRLVGKLIYLTHTRPDLSYAVSVVSQFMHNPSEQHMSAVNRILAYLKSSPGKGILYSKEGHLDIMGYTDSDFAGSRLDRKSTSGYVSFVGGNLVTWRSKKQNVVSLSSAEAEYRALHHATTELTWLKLLLSELGFGPDKPMLLFCDNTAAIKIANNPVQHDRTKHVELDRNYIKDNLDSKNIEVPYIKRVEQLADVMTHGVASGPFHTMLSKLGMRDIYAPT